MGIDPLQAYRAKRDFSVTPEPPAGGPLLVASSVFVVHKHWAGSLHYDFRLALDGSLKSWAVPKGPSLDPAVKRMAVPVEDHPLAYAAFEGCIPARQYGAGRVIVWDAGTWQPLGDPRQGLADGNLKFDLHGHKLQGRWVLVRMNGRGEKPPGWLLIKEKDSHARATAAYSVVDALPDSVGPLGAARGDAVPAEAVPCALPAAMSPQLATLAVGPPPDAADWLCEIKFDGYRLLVRNDAAGARLFTRNGHDWTSKLPGLKHAFDLRRLPPGWYDGEAVVLNEAGLPDFGALQQAFDGRRTDTVLLYLFDVPYAAGHDLRGVPLHARRSFLKGLLGAPRADPVRFSEAFDADMASVVASACRMGLEGVIAKRRGSSYRSARNGDWLKLKCSQRQEFVIGGYTLPQGARQGFGALLLGVHDAHGMLRHAGNVGTGFTQNGLTALKKALDSRAQPTSPFSADLEIAGSPRWVAPTLVAEVSFGEWTRSGHIRHAVFRGLRSDKDAGTVVRERAQRAPGAASAAAAAAPEAQPLRMRTQVTNPQRVIDASTGATKLEVVRYYGLVGGLMMKHLKGRPVALLRAPAGVAGPLFFQKHAETERLTGIRQLDPALFDGHLPMIEVAGRQGLLSAAQWNVIEFHTLNTVATSFAHPDRMVFDLDPGEGVAWAQVQEAAQLVHAFLGQLGLPSFLKTSGGKGLHVVVPVRRVHGWAAVKGFSRAVVMHMAEAIPQRFVARSGAKNRIGRVFIDYLRNGMGASTACAWSVRARPGLGISVPVAWEELPALRGGDHWRVETAPQRLAIGNAPWAGYAKAARGLNSAMSALNYVADEE